jgi:hypothetical protein
MLSFDSSGPPKCKKDAALVVDVQVTTRAAKTVRQATKLVDLDMWRLRFPG